MDSVQILSIDDGEWFDHYENQIYRNLQNEFTNNLYDVMINAMENMMGIDWGIE